MLVPDGNAFSFFYSFQVSEDEDGNVPDLFGDEPPPVCTCHGGGPYGPPSIPYRDDDPDDEDRDADEDDVDDEHPAPAPPPPPVVLASPAPPPVTPTPPPGPPLTPLPPVIPDQHQLTLSPPDGYKDHHLYLKALHRGKNDIHSGLEKLIILFY